MRAGCDSVVCGHIHHAAIRDIDRVLYCNDGDWVESCSSLQPAYVSATIAHAARISARIKLEPMRNVAGASMKL